MISGSRQAHQSVSDNDTREALLLKTGELKGGRSLKESKRV